MKRRRSEHGLPFRERLDDLAKRLRREAARLPPGKAQDDLLQRARQAETAIGINTWLSSTGQTPPDLDPQVLAQMRTGCEDAGLSDGLRRATAGRRRGSTGPR